MNLIVITITLSLLYFATSQNNISQVTLYTHQWCPNCQLAENLISKLQTKYSDIQFIIEEHHSTQALKRKTNANQQEQLPYPFVLINCSGIKFSYQNDFNFLALDEEINTHCKHKLQICRQKYDDETYLIKINQANFENQSNQTLKKNLFAAYLLNPHLKLCLSKNSKNTISQSIAQIQKIKQKTLFFDTFSHNIRNFLIKSERMAISLVYTERNNPKAKLYHDVIGILGYLFRAEAPKNISKLLAYELSLQQKQQLAFFSLCINSDTSKCLHGRSKQLPLNKITHTLLNFLDVDVFDGDHPYAADNIALVAFRFKYGKLQKYVYGGLHLSIGEQFVFWISNILRLSQNQSIDQQDRYCLSNRLIHRIQSQSLMDLYIHAKLKTELKPFNIEIEQRIARYHPRAKLDLCLTNEIAQEYDGNMQDISKIVRRVQYKLNSSHQSQQQL